MNWENIKEQLLERWNGIWERIRDSDSYIQLRERYHNMSPSMQKITIWASITFGILFILLIPWTLISTSSESIDTFENNVRLVRDFYRVQRELANSPAVPETPTSADISNRVQSILNQAGLAQEQINGPRQINPEREEGNALQPIGITEQGVEVTLLKLNVKQVSEIGTRLSQLGQGLHLTALDMRVSSSNDHYYDVIFRVTGFSVPGSSSESAPEPEAPENPTPPKAPGRGAS